MTEFALVGKKKILIVEDHPLFRAMLVQLVEKELDMTVCGEADNTEDAMKLIEQSRPDAAIVDIILRKSSGLELINDLKTRSNSLPVLVLSMYPAKRYAERVIQAGAKGYVSKKESTAVVIAAVREVLAGRIYGSPQPIEALPDRTENTATRVAPGMDLISDQEMKVFQLFGHGLTSRDVAEQLDLESHTVDSARARIKEKLALENTAELYQRAAQWVAESRQ